MSGQRNIAVIGCGGWGKNIVRTLSAEQGFGVLRAVVDPSPAGRARAAALAPEAAVYERPEPVWDDHAVAGVMIATPAETHYRLARDALDAGKDVFVEKPLTIEVGEARDLCARADAAGRILMVGHLLEYHPAILALRDLVSSGELGQVRYIVSNRLNLGKIRTEENALWSFAPHDIAVILRLLDALPRQVVATGGSYLTPGIADVTVTQLLFESGVRGHIFVSWLHPFKEQKLVVIGSKRMASFDDVAKRLVLHDQRVDWEQGQPVPVRGEGTDVAFPSTEPLKEECRHFIECMARRRTPRTGGADGVRVLEILHAAQHSLLAEGRPVEPVWPEAAALGGEAEAPVPLIETVSVATAVREQNHDPL
ncbi:MAG: Gfo/Idh/MocA family oxidoreductase [Planctomycetota bacterium]|nr:Gfo/Idh/MocA family oxidoreductase [Planctomycetota bacterium]